MRNRLTQAGFSATGRFGDTALDDQFRVVVPRNKDIYLKCDLRGRNCISEEYQRVRDKMLRLTKKADYGLMALKFLAERPDMPSLSAKDIAEAYGIPPQLLAKILQRLTKSGLLRSHAGTNGGYALSRSPETITAFEVIGAIDGPLFITSCETGPRACDLTDSCTIREPLRKVNQSIAEVLKAIRVSDLCESRPAEPVLVSLGR